MIDFCSSICLRKRGLHMALNLLYDVFLIKYQIPRKENVKLSFKRTMAHRGMAL